MSGEFVISLDFELLWGLRDRANRDSYGRNILGAREAVPQMLDLFARNGISATWATVGLLFCESRDELMASMPPEELQPRYANPALSNYSYLSEVGKNEAEDPYYFAASLIDRIASTEGQEIATHTFSHFYTLEPGATADAFAADLAAARAVAARRGITLRSIVFPRNQYGAEHVQICETAGITSWRGNPDSWAYRATAGQGQTLLRRGVRLVDAYSGFLGPQTYVPESGSMRNAPASRFLRPCAGKLAPLHPAHIRTILRGMSSAASAGRGYHLWWHPHNFGRDLEANLEGLRQILAHFQRLHKQYSFDSVAMDSARGRLK